MKALIKYKSGLIKCIEFDEMNIEKDLIMFYIHIREKAFARALPINPEEIESITTDHFNSENTELINTINELKNINEVLEKALDKACYELGVLDNSMLDQDKWKEWLIETS